MIYILGGFVILIISFAVALVSLVREQKASSGFQPDTSEKKADDENGSYVSDPQNIKSDEEIKSAQKEEAYRILQNRVLRMTEQEAGGESVKVQPDVAGSNLSDDAIEPDTNIEDPAEEDLALSQKVPLPWEEQAGVMDSVLPETLSMQDKHTQTKLPDEEDDSKLSDKLSGQINISDLDKKT